MKRWILIFLFAAASAAAGEYHGNKKSFVFHDSGCTHFNCKNCSRIFAERDDAIAAGYRPCKLCRP